MKPRETRRATREASRDAGREMKAEMRCETRCETRRRDMKPRRDCCRLRLLANLSQKGVPMCGSAGSGAEQSWRRGRRDLGDRRSGVEIRHLRATTTGHIGFIGGLRSPKLRHHTDSFLAPSHGTLAADDVPPRGCTTTKGQEIHATRRHDAPRHDNKQPLYHGRNYEQSACEAGKAPGSPPPPMKYAP